MDFLIFQQIGWGALGGCAAYLVFHGVLALRIVRLQFAVVTLQNQLLSVRNTTRVQKRWNERDNIEAAMAEELGKVRRPAQRFDNDPLVYDPSER